MSTEQAHLRFTYSTGKRTHRLNKRRCRQRQRLNSLRCGFAQQSSAFQVIAEARDRRLHLISSRNRIPEDLFFRSTDEVAGTQMENRRLHCLASPIAKAGLDIVAS